MRSTRVACWSDVCSVATLTCPALRRTRGPPPRTGSQAAYGRTARPSPARTSPTRARRRPAHRVEVVAVDRLAVHPVRARALVEVGLGRCALDRRAHPVLVVDHEEHDRQLPQRGHVERLVPGAHVDRAVAELADDRLLLALAYEREREPRREREL